MKNIIILVLIIIGLGITSCEDFLVEKPKTFISSDQFFTSKESFEKVLLGLYSPLYGWAGVFGNHGFEYREFISEYCDLPSGSDALQISVNTPTEDSWASRMNWSIPYSTIANANLILTKLGAAELDPNDENQIEAEARFMRGWSYFQLVRLFGDVPIRTEVVSGFEDMKIPRASQVDVYKLIVDDISFAEANLPDVNPVQGRAYKWAAKALLARIYLTMAGNPLNQADKMSMARDKALEVINSGKFSLMDDFADVFHNTAYTSESIWEVVYKGAGGGNYLMWLCTGEPGQATIKPHPDFIASFLPGDRRREWGIKDSYTDKSGKLIVNFPYFNKYVNEQFFEDGITGQSTNISEYTAPLIRLAEMYLIAAEAENEVNGPANALQYINKIRERAGIPDLNSGISKNDFKEAVWKERRWELHIEGQGWFDLKRTNRFNLLEQARTLSVPVGPWNQTWPISDFEIINNDIPQNPAYGGK